MRKSKLFLKRSKAAKKGWKTLRQNIAIKAILEAQKIKRYKKLKKPTIKKVKRIIKRVKRKVKRVRRKIKRRVSLGLTPSQRKKIIKDLETKLRKEIEQKIRKEIEKEIRKEVEREIEKEYSKKLDEEIKAIHIEDMAQCEVIQDKAEKKHDREIKKTEKESKKPVKLTENMIYQIDDAQNIIDHVKSIIQSFAEDYNYTQQTTGAIRADGSCITQSRFTGIDEDLFRDFTLNLEETLRVLGPGYRISLGFAFDPNNIIKPIQYINDNTIRIGEPGYETDIPYYKGMANPIMHPSVDFANTFVTFRENLYPALVDKIGQFPDQIDLRIYHGETILKNSGESTVQKISRDDIKI